ncbi:MAG: hypothetical protein ACOYNI_08665 [Acidimicrobiia bacterium]
MEAFRAVMAQVQALAAAEREFASVVGSWAGDPAVPDDQRVCFARLVRHAAWRADQWASLAPTPAGLVVDGLGAFAAPIAGLRQGVDGSAAAAVLGQLWALASQLAAADPVGQAAVQRVARRVRGDLEADLELLGAESGDVLAR